MKKSKIVGIALVISLLVGIVPAVQAATIVSDATTPQSVIITKGSTIARSGPGIGFKDVGVAYKDSVLQCIGQSGNWYVVQLKNDVIGMISNDSARIYPSASAMSSPNSTAAKSPQTAKAQPPSGKMTDAQIADATKMLSLINAERAKVNAPALKMDTSLQNVAKIKADDMVKKNYFAHTSPTYGTPFNMMKTFGITYKAAGENLAGNGTVEKAHAALMNSPGHKKNILSTSYNTIGIGVTNSPAYGKIFVQMFIGK